MHTAKIDMDGWLSIDLFHDLITVHTNTIIERTANVFGLNSHQLKDNSITTASKVTDAKKIKLKTDRHKANAVKKIKRDEKLFVGYETVFDKFYGSLLLFAEKFGNADRPFTLPVSFLDVSKSNDM